MAEPLKGAPGARALTEELAARCVALRERGVVPTLAIVRVGERLRRTARLQTKRQFPTRMLETAEGDPTARLADGPEPDGGEAAPTADPVQKTPQLEK